MIFLIDSHSEMRKCLTLILRNYEIKAFSNGIEAMNEISETGPPDLILLDILIDGPDGFAFLNEMISYEDTMNVPIFIISSLDFSAFDLSVYSVTHFFQKETMHPAELKAAVAAVLSKKVQNAC